MRTLRSPRAAYLKISSKIFAHPAILSCVSSGVKPGPETTSSSTGTACTESPALKLYSTMNTSQNVIGKAIGLIAILGFVVERLTSIPSTLLGKMVCGENYLKPVGGVTGDGSCGFNTDMHLTAFFTILLVVGVLLIVRKTGN